MIEGEFIDDCPVIKAGASNNGRLVLGKGNELIVVDSGFNGDISIPPELFNKLELEFCGVSKFQLADGSKVWKALWAGEVKLAKDHFVAFFIEGDFLLGMDLASRLFSYFLLDFDNQKVELKFKKKK